MVGGACVEGGAWERKYHLMLTIEHALYGWSARWNANVIDQSSCGKWLKFLRGRKRSENILDFLCTLYVFYIFLLSQELRTFEWSRVRLTVGASPHSPEGSSSVYSSVVERSIAVMLLGFVPSALRQTEVGRCLLSSFDMVANYITNNLR